MINLVNSSILIILALWCILIVGLLIALDVYLVYYINMAIKNRNKVIPFLKRFVWILTFSIAFLITTGLIFIMGDISTRLIKMSISLH